MHIYAYTTPGEAFAVIVLCKACNYCSQQLDGTDKLKSHTNKLERVVNPEPVAEPLPLCILGHALHCIIDPVQ